jgi:hypothetical protein
MYWPWSMFFEVMQRTYWAIQWSWIDLHTKQRMGSKDKKVLTYLFTFPIQLNLDVRDLDICDHLFWYLRFEVSWLFSPIGIKPRDWRGDFPHSLYFSDHSQLSLFISLTEVHYIRVLYNDLLFQLLNVFHTSKNCLYLVKYKRSCPIRLSRLFRIFVCVI